jgi:predicted MFS family arabinose efflux permease
MSAAFATGSGTGSWFGGYGYDTWGSYTIPFTLAILGTLISVTIVQVVSRKSGENAVESYAESAGGAA